MARAKKWFSDHNEALNESLNTRSFHYDFTRIYNTFVKHFGEEEGELKFKYFVSSNKLDTAKRYHPLIQFHESFQWVKPLIFYLRQDKEAKYYGITCITANISMNNKPYPADDLKPATISMHYRPINLNHNHSKWLPFPRTRIDWAKFEENAVEGILRVDHRDKWLQKKLDTHEILHPSIEGRPIPPDLGGGFHFTALALLEKGVMIPGDPLTSIQPLMLNENLYESIGRMITEGEEVPIENEKMSVEDIKKKIVDLTLKISSLDKKLYGGKSEVKPEPSITNVERTKIRAEIDNARSELEGYKQALQSKTIMKALSEKTEEQTLKLEHNNIVSEETTVATADSSNEIEGKTTREETLKIVGLETTNKLLQEEIEGITSKFKALKKESTKTIVDLEAKNKTLTEKTSVLDGLKGTVGDQATALIKSQETVTKRDTTIEDNKITIEALEDIVTKKDMLVEKLRKEITTEEEATKDAKKAKRSAEVAMEKLKIDKVAAEKDALEAIAKETKYHEEYTDAFNRCNDEVQKNRRLTNKFHTVSEANNALKEQLEKDGKTIERLRRDAKIQEKRADKATKERKEALTKIGVIEVNSDGTVEVDNQGNIKI